MQVFCKVSETGDLEGIVGKGGHTPPCPFLDQPPPLFYDSPLSRNPRCPHLS